VAAIKRWSWLVVGVIGVVLVVLGLVVLDGAAGGIVLAFGLLALFGAAVRVITRGQPVRDEGRVPAGHSGV